MILQPEMVLYHGSYTEIESIDLRKCDEAKDFGRGFYLTSSQKQAAAFIKTALAKAKRNGRIPAEQTHGFVTEYQFCFDPNIRYYEFEETNKDWLYYIAVNRRSMLAKNLKPLLSRDFDRYEILAGKIANDDTNVTLNTFLAGVYGEVDSSMAFETVTHLLKPERLHDQFCFKTERAIRTLKKLGAERYEIS